jgi:thiamine pyrophosphokinase
MARLWWLSENAINFVMIDKFLRSSGPVSLVGGGEVGKGDLELALTHAPRVYAVDSGAGAVLAAGHQPEAVIGDFDSVAEADLTRVPAERLFRIDEQDTTDFEKALTRIHAPLVIGVGFLGLRLDHQLAAFNALVKHANRPCILIGQTEVVCHVTGAFAADLQAGDTVSLFPMLAVSGRSSGLAWPIDGLSLAPGGRIGTSNRAEGPVRIEVDGPGLLMLLPRARLSEIVAAIHRPE